MEPALPTIQSVQAGSTALTEPRYKPAVPVPVAGVGVVLSSWIFGFLSAFSRGDEYFKLDPHLEPVLPVSMQLMTDECWQHL